jgi:acetyl esterase/lipase
MVKTDVTLIPPTRVKGALPLPTHRGLKTGLGVRGVYVDPAPELIHGELQQWADIARVEPVRLPGYWMHKRGTSLFTGQKPSPGDKVVYHLHGGAFIGFSAHPWSPTSDMPGLMLKECEKVKRSFALEYRLSVGAPLEPEHPFPTALVDALAGYNYLVNTVGFVPEDIIVAGDSAGGNLALALTRYLVEYRKELTGALTAEPVPGALFLLCPWSDLSTATYADPTCSCITNQSTDYLVGFAGPFPSVYNTPDENYAARAYVGPHGFEVASLTNPYISPASLSLPEGKGGFKGFPKTMVIAGDAEQLVDEVRRLVGRMEKDLGREGDGGLVKYFEGKDAVHDYLLYFWHDSAREETIEEIKRWVTGL